MNLQNMFGAERFKNPTARGLFRFAWGFEIIAVILGFAISLATFLLAYKEARSIDPGVASMLNAFIAFAPFFMVALSELAKIPIAEAAYTAKRGLWSFVFGCVLLFLAIITFETVFNGLERNFALLKYKIDDKWTQLQEVKSSVADDVDKIGNLEQLTIESINQQHESRVAELTKQREDSLRVVNEQIDKLDAESGLDAVKELRSRRERKIAEKDDVVETGISVANQRELKQLADAIAQRTNEIDVLRADRAGISGFFKGRERRAIDENIKRLEQDRKNLERKVQEINQTAAHASQLTISRLDKEISELDERIGQAVGRADDEVRNKRAPLEREAEQIRAKFADGQQAADQRRDAQIANLTDNEKDVKELDGEKDEKIASQRKLENKINEDALKVQVYRIALNFAGEREAHKLEPKYVTIVALVWFGSLSAVVALTGIMLAFGAFVIEYGVAKENNRSPARKMLNSMRRALLPMRKFKRREKVITKVVTETVPKEVLVKEIVHVPVLVGGEHKVKTETSAIETGQVDAVKMTGDFEKSSEHNKE